MLRLPNFIMVGVVVTILSFGKPVIVPLVFAALFAFILSPLVELVQRIGIGRVPAVLLVILAALAFSATMAYVLADQLFSLAVELPTHRAEIQAKLDGLRGMGSGGLTRLIDMVKDLTSEPGTGIVVTAPAESVADDMLDLAGGIVARVASAFVVMLLVIFMLIRREDVRNRALGLLGHGRLTGATRATVEAVRGMGRLLLMQLAVNNTFGATFGLGLAIIGVPYAFLWGTGLAVLRFIPYVGVLIAAGGPALLAIATTPGWGAPVAVLVMVIVLEITIANVIEPLLFSHHTGVSPLALLVAALFWTWLWGPLGLVLSTPLTLCLVVLGQNAPRFRFLATLLGDRPVLSAHDRYYQRLLAVDEREAFAVASEHVSEHGPAATFDDVLLPALRHLRSDRERETVAAEEEA
jgi:predicted PurR-regulated permease PerM